MVFTDHGEAILRGLPPKKLPYKGKWYTFPVSVSAATGLVLARIMDQAVKAAGDVESADDVTGQDVYEGLDESERKNLRGEVLGDAQWKLIKDNVPGAVVDHMEQTLMMWHMTGSQEVAEAYWDDVGGPKAPADHQPKSSGSTAKRSTRSASSTRKRASIAATPLPEPAAAAPDGRTSSPTGRS